MLKIGGSKMFPWSESGLRLLNRIELLIQENGGNDSMYQIVIEEINNESFVSDNRRLRESFERIVRYNIRSKDGSEMLQMPINKYKKELQKYIKSIENGNTGSK